jgi:esterase/lipase superfamily enzyme
VNREYHAWHSPALGRWMELLVFGHGGARVLVFPTSMGRFYEWEDQGMIGAVREHLQSGWLQLFCVDSVDAESWYAKWAHPAHRADRHRQYERYLTDEVLPLTRQKNSNPYLIATGASFGAYHAANFAFRHPDMADRVLGLSGLYDIRLITDGYSDETVYFNNPHDFLAHEHDPERLRRLRHLDVILAIGRDDPNCRNNEAFSGVLWHTGIWHALRIWDGWCHDWPWWRQMLPLYIGGAG